MLITFSVYDAVLRLFSINNATVLVRENLIFTKIKVYDRRHIT